MELQKNRLPAVFLYYAYADKQRERRANSSRVSVSPRRWPLILHLSSTVAIPSGAYSSVLFRQLASVVPRMPKAPFTPRRNISSEPTSSRGAASGIKLTTAEY